MEILKTRDLILKQGEVCDHCLGRQFALAFKKYRPAQIGAAIRKAKKDSDIEKNLKKEAKIHETEKCFVCSGLFKKIDSLTKKVFQKAKEQEFNNFLIGSRVSEKIISNEESLWLKIGTMNAQPIKREVNTIIGMAVEKKTKKKAEFKYPDVVFIVDFEKEKVFTQLNSLYIFGRYRKLVRGIPQTKWPCRECGGTGCTKCDGTGKQYKETIEDLIAPHFLKAFGAKHESFHGEGREDIDALMLGNGRPFVFEVKDPVKRKVNLGKLEREINKATKGKVEVHDLKLSDVKEMRLVKARAHDKLYECIIECKGITRKDLEKLEKFFENKEIAQKTPQRVLHRRADLIRKRKIKHVKCRLISKNTFKAEILSEAGTYIKELVSGDNERTKPSFTGVLKKPCIIKELNVIGIQEVE